MTRIAFFGHDADDAAVRRRARAFANDGMDVVGFMMRRSATETPTSWKNTDLGQTRDGAFVSRIVSIFSGARRAANDKATLEGADVIYARNLDMLACAFLAKRYTRLSTPVIYESLDVHRLLTRTDIVGRMMRWFEKALLKRTRALVVSSPAFLKNHFEPNYKGQYRAFLVENRIDSGAGVGPRPEKVSPSERQTKLRIGWVGMLRCQRSFDLLCSLADAFPDQIEVRLHGVPARIEIPVFEPHIDSRPNMTYFGKYQAPEGLEEIYGGLDLVWAGDFMEAGFNSVWLLPNRIYEGGYYATPAIAPAGTQTAAWLEQNGCGFLIDEPLETSLIALVGKLVEDRTQIAAQEQQLMSLGDEVFVQPQGFLKQVIDETLSIGATS